MRTIYPVLQEHISKHGTSFRELATITNSNIISLCLKMWGLKRWKLTDVVSICCFFNNPNAEHLFCRGKDAFVQEHYNTKQNKSQ